MQRGDNGTVVSAHPVMDQAQAVTRRYIRPDRRTHYHDPLYEEVLMTTALAIIEGHDPEQAAVDVLRRERTYRARHLPMLVVA